MILDALVDQFVQRFRYEKRARVCLWFDERQEFARLLPALRGHLAAMKPPPFRLLEYDGGEGRGQIWLKYEVHRTAEVAEPDVRQHLRFVLYLPLSEDRLDGPGKNGDPSLDLLTEYRLGGVIWRIGGKRPTMFTFLRQAGVPLSESPAEQRRLYEDSRDSLLAKYVATFINRPPTFWTTTLTPEVARSRLIGDLDQTILDLAVEPEVTWQCLVDRGLHPEFVDMVEERYGFVAATESLTAWLCEFTAMLALTEHISVTRHRPISHSLTACRQYPCGNTTFSFFSAGCVTPRTGSPGMGGSNRSRRSST